MVYTSEYNNLRPRKPINIFNWTNTKQTENHASGQQLNDNMTINLFANKQFNKNYDFYESGIKENETIFGFKKRFKLQSVAPYDETIQHKEGNCNCTEFKKNLREYLLSTTLHGLRYIGDGKLSLFERLFWLISFTLAIMTASYFIQNVYYKWTNSPTIISLNPEPVTLISIPFPAITICNVNQAKKSVANRIRLTGSKMDKKILQSVCSINNDSLDMDASIQNADWDYFKQFLITVTQPCSEMLAVCMWRSEVRDCHSLFNTALTDEGLCCTFNSVHRDLMFRNPKDLSDLNITFPFPSVDWTPETGYPPDAPLDGFPWRPTGSGANLGLTLVLDADVEEYYCSSTNSAGFKVLLHNPAETPKIADFGDLVPPGAESRLALLPHIGDAALDLRNVPINKRNCVFETERHLIYYRTYTQKNCVMECEAKLTVEKCNCSQYFMPKNRTTRVCGKADARCYHEMKIEIEDKLNINASSPTLCDECLPACFELSFGKDMSAGVLTDSFHIRQELLAGRTVQYFKTNMAVIHLYFIDTTFTRFSKGVIFGFTEFLSNTGGLLGLFMGFSFLSVVEIAYFVSLRVLCALCRRRRAPPPATSALYPFTP